MSNATWLAAVALALLIVGLGIYRERSKLLARASVNFGGSTPAGGGASAALRAQRRWSGPGGEGDPEGGSWAARFDWLAVGIIALAFAATFAVLNSVWLPLRVAVVFGFLLLGPGLPFVRLLRIGHVGIQLTLAVALSLVLDTAVSEGMALARVWSVGAALTILVVVSVVGALSLIVVSARQARKGMLW